MRETESNIEKFFQQTVKSMGGKAYKWVSPNNRGVPDRICFFPGGLIIVAELKAPGKSPRPLQEKVIKTLRALGTEVVVISSFNQIRIFKEIVSEVLDNALATDQEKSNK